MKIVFTKSRKKFAIASKLIAWYQGTEYSHVALEAGDYYYQANEGKVNKEHYRYFLKEHAIIVSYEIPNIDLNLLELELGRDYGFIQNMGIILVDLFKLFKKQISNPLTNGVNCSEFILQKVISQFAENLQYDPDYVKPKHIEQILRGRVKNV